MNKGTVVAVTRAGDQMILTAADSEIVQLPITEEIASKFEYADTLVGLYNSDDDVWAGLATLHLHTGFSLLDGAIKAKELTKLITENEHDYPKVVAITDHGSMSGCYNFCVNMEEKGLVPIIGCEVYCESIDGQKDNNHLILLCKDDVGYHNLCKLLSKAEKNFYRHAQISWAMLREHGEGLVCLSACLGGEVQRRFANGDKDGAMTAIENFIDIFGKDFYLEIQNHGIVDEHKVKVELIKVAKELGIKIVGTTDSHYLKKEHSKYHEILLCVGTQSTLEDETHFKFEGSGYHFLNETEMFETFNGIREAFNNMAEITLKCQFRFKKQDIIMPVFDTGGVPVPEAFETLVRKGFDERFPDKSLINEKEYNERLSYELEIIKKMKFESYFLVVYDFIAYARSIGIAIGPGRGSAVGSLASYCIGITNLDPIPYGLLFEREMIALVKLR